MTTRADLFARYKALDALATDYDTALSEPLYTLRMTAYCDYLLSDPYFDWSEMIRQNYGPQFARLPLLPAVCPSPEKEQGRESGVIVYVSRDYGYIQVDGAEETGERNTKFYTRHVFGNVPMKGDKVTFTRGISGNALDVVLSDAATSREAYSAKMAQRPATAPARRGRASDGGGFQFTENTEELARAREAVRKLREGL